MIVGERFSAVAVVRSIWRPLFSLFVLDCLVTVAYVGFGWTFIAPRELPLELIGTGLAVFLAFRNNTAYARWWEARTLWGAVVNHSRSFARAVPLLMPGRDLDDLRRELVLHQIAYVHALRTGLRREDTAKAIRRILGPDFVGTLDDRGNAAFALQRRMAWRISHALEEGRIDTITAAALNTTLSALADAQGGLERIANTPMPRQYASLPRIFVAIYCTMLPFEIVRDLGIATPIGSTLVGFLFLALDQAGRNLETPFARTVHEIPMSAICRTIEVDLRASIEGGPPLAPLHPVGGILR